MNEIICTLQNVKNIQGYFKVIDENYEYIAKYIKCHDNRCYKLGKMYTNSTLDTNEITRHSNRIYFDKNYGVFFFNKYDSNKKINIIVKNIDPIFEREENSDYIMLTISNNEFIRTNLSMSKISIDIIYN